MVVVVVVVGWRVYFIVIYIVVIVIVVVVLDVVVVAADVVAIFVIIAFTSLHSATILLPSLYACLQVSNLIEVSSFEFAK